MIDPRLLREDPQRIREGIAAKGVKLDLDQILTVDQERRQVIREVENLQNRRNTLTKETGQRRQAGEAVDELVAQVKEINARLKQLEAKRSQLEKTFRDLMLQIPNPPHSSVPVGHDARENPVVKSWGTLPRFDFPIKDHLQLGQDLGLFDFLRGTRISGTGFPLYTGKGAKLERALINFMLDFHIERHGYQEILPPFLVNEASMTMTSQLPKFAEDMYLVEKDDLYLIPTAEVPVTNIHRGEILRATDLPLKYVAYSACFRREAGSYGKETRGFLRLHQFNKVELVKFTHPDESYAELETLRRDAEEILEALELPYRVVELVTGDLSFAAAKCYDLEVWAPAEERWLEVSSCSNFEDFQARRGAVRFREAGSSRPRLVHTLNGSGVATPRLLVALLEIHQQPDGHVKIPAALVPYTGFEML